MSEHTAETDVLVERLRDLVAGSQEVIPYKAGDELTMACPRANGRRATQRVNPLNWNNPDQLFVYCLTTGCLSHYKVSDLPKRYRVARPRFEAKAAEALPKLLDLISPPGECP